MACGPFSFRAPAASGCTSILIQTDTFHTDRNQALFLKGRENPIETPLVCPTAQSCIDRVPIRIFIQELAIMDFDIAALYW